MDPKNTVIVLVCQAEKRKRLIESLKKKYYQLRIVPVVCMGKINPAMLFRLLVKDTRGVILIGCDPSDCHYREGALFSDRRFFLVKEILKGFGMDEDLLQVIWSNPGKTRGVLQSVDAVMNRFEKSFASREGAAHE